MLLETLQPLLVFLAGYLAILAVPGPNMLAIGSLAALGGLAAVLPMILGTALGASVLACGLLVLLETAARLVAGQAAAQAIGAAMLLVVATVVLRRPATAPEGAALRSHRRAGLAALLAGFTTAVTNPVTAAYFLGQFLGPLGQATQGLVAVLLVGPLACGFWLGIAALLSRPALRGLARRRERVLRHAAAAALGGMALVLAWPLLAGLPSPLALLAAPGRSLLMLPPG